MAVWFKRLAIGLAALIVLLVAVVAGALVMIDTEALKRIVSEQVEANTGRELTIEGDLGISIFPWIGFELGSTRLANAEGFDKRPFAALERAELRVELLPLFRREVSVDRVVLHGFALNLARDVDGRGNWEDLVPEGDEQAAAEPAEPGEPAAPAEGPDMSLRVEGVELRDANLAWRDASTGQDLIVRDLDLETGPLAIGEPTPLRLSVTLEPTDAPALGVELETRATFDPAGPRIRLAGLRVDLDARGDALPGGALSARVVADLDADLEAGRIGIASLVLGVADTLEARGEATADIAGDTPAVEGRLALESFNPRDLFDALEIEPPGYLHKKALKSADVAFTFSAAGDTVRVDDLVLNLDDTRAEGALQARAGDIPATELRLSVDGIDLDRYLPPPAEGEPEPGAGEADTVEPGPDPVASLPLESLRGFRANAAVDVGRLRIRGLDATDLVLRARVDDGLVVLKRLDVGIAEGSVALGARLDGRTDTPAAGLDLRLEGIQSEPLLQAVLDSAPVSGRLDAGIELDTAGPTLDDWIAALDGRLVTTFSEGAVEGFNIAQRIRVARAKLSGDPVEKAEQVKRTDFSRLHLDATIRKGVVHAGEVDLRAPLLRVGGAGEIDLVDRKLDFVTRVLVTGTLAGEGGAGGEELKGLEIPLRIHGPFTGPEIELAFEEALEARLKAKRDELKEKAREAADEAEEEARDAAKKAEEETRAAAEKEKKRLREKQKEKERELERKKEKKKKEAEEKLEEELEGLFD